MKQSNLNLFTELLNISQTAFSFHLCQFSQGRVFICEDKQKHMRSLEEIGTLKHPIFWSSLASWQAGLTLEKCRCLSHLSLLGSQLSDALDERSQQGQFGPLGPQVLLGALLFSPTAVDCSQTVTILSLHLLQIFLQRCLGEKLIRSQQLGHHTGWRSSVEMSCSCEAVFRKVSAGLADDTLFLLERMKPPFHHAASSKWEKIRSPSVSHDLSMQWCRGRNPHEIWLWHVAFLVYHPRQGQFTA